MPSGTLREGLTLGNDMYGQVLSHCRMVGARAGGVRHACAHLRSSRDRTRYFEHFAAFFALGLLFLLAYPNRIAVVLLVVIGAALELETLQLLTPDRHGRLVDALTQVAGGACGMAVGLFARGAAQIAKERIAASSR